MIGKIEFDGYGVEGFSMGNGILNFRQMNLFAGANGLGKTMVFKAAWFMSFSLNLHKIIMMLGHSKVLPIEMADAYFKENLQTVFDMTFTSPERVSGAISISDSDDAIFKFAVSMTDGKLEHFNIDILDPEKYRAGEVNTISYNSKEARTFSQYDRYVKLETKFGITSIQDLSQLKELGEFYRLYDILWFQKIKADMIAYENGEKNIDEKAELWNKTFEKNFTGSDAFPRGEQFRFKDGMAYVDSDIVTMKPLTDYDLGTQSLIMLTLFAN